MAKSNTSENLKLLREMLNTEVNTAMFNPDVRDHTPQNVIIIIENTDGRIHCIKPDDKELSERMIQNAAKTIELGCLPMDMFDGFFKPIDVPPKKD